MGKRLRLPLDAVTQTFGFLARKGLGEWEPLPTGEDLRQYWIAKLSGGKRRILQVLVDAHPSFVDRDELARRAELTSNAGTFSTYLGRLRKLDLLESDPRGFRVAADLFEA
jgi:uncharacterized protein